MEFTTADLCDAHPQLVHLLPPWFRDFGGLTRFAGPVETVKVFEDNTLVRQVLETAGGGRVLVVDGAGSQRCALVGGQLAGLAHRLGWAGLLVHGCVRDSAELASVPIGIRALNTCPWRSGKGGGGKRGTTITFGGIAFSPNMYLYADPDGVLLSDRDLLDRPS